MTIPVLVEPLGSAFTARMLGAPTVAATGDTKDAAVDALRTVVATRMSSGDLVMMDVQPQGLLALSEKFKDDPQWNEMWDDIVKEAYRYRDELKAQEFPE